MTEINMNQYRLTDEEIVKNFKLVQVQLNELTQKMNDFAEMLHKDNSDAIDEIVISLLTKEETTTTGGEENV